MLVGAARADLTFARINVPGAADTVASGINNAGQIVGWYQDQSGVQNAFLDNNGAFTTLGGQWTFAQGINDRGQITGYYWDAAGYERSFLYSSGVFTNIGTPGYFAQGINNAGQIVGYYVQPGTGTDAAQGFLYNNGTITLTNVPGAATTKFYGINNAGQIVGAASTTGGTFANGGFLYSNGIFTPITASTTATATVPLGINDQGQIVGYYNNPSPPNGGPASVGPNGFLDTNGVFTTIDVPNAYWNEATGINNAGQVVGQSSDYYNVQGGHGFGFEATVNVPEPSSLTISGVAIAIVLAIKLRFFR